MTTVRTFRRGQLVALSVDGIQQMVIQNHTHIIPDWPIWAKALKQLSIPEDKGIGDVVARIIGDETSEKFKAWHLATFGRPCGCNGRQARWNRMYPLNVST